MNILKEFGNFPTRILISKKVGFKTSSAKYRKFCPIRDYFIKFIKSLRVKIMRKKQFAIACTFFLIIAHMFRRWKQMQKSLVWKGFLSESMWVEGYGDLSPFKKLVFWMNYPFSLMRDIYGMLYGIVLTDCISYIQEQDH